MKVTGTGRSSTWFKGNIFQADSRKRVFFYAVPEKHFLLIVLPLPFLLHLQCLKNHIFSTVIENQIELPINSAGTVPKSAADVIDNNTFMAPGSKHTAGMLNTKLPDVIISLSPCPYYATFFTVPMFIITHTSVDTENWYFLNYQFYN